MASKSTNTGDAGRIRIVVNVTGSNAVSNWTDVSWEAYLDERTEYNYSYSASTPAKVTVNGVTVFDGNFSWDWRASGKQTKKIASGTRRINHNADGTKTLTSVLWMGNTYTSGAAGPATATLNQELPTLKVLPGVPENVLATRVSDSQTTVSWEQTSAANGQPETLEIQERVNDGEWLPLTTISPASSVVVSTSPNEKTEYRVRGANLAGYSDWSDASAPLYTTPASPSGATALKNVSQDIVVSFTSNVAYAEHEHEIWHGVVSGGSTSWDSSALATLPSGTLSYTHSSPNPSQVHIYRVRAKTGSLVSGYATSAAVQLLAPPNKPTLPSLAPYADAGADLQITWVHNPVDTTPQTAYQLDYAVDGGAWVSGTKTSSTSSSFTIPAETYSPETSLVVRVRTWGASTTGGSDGTGASPWSDLKTVVFKTAPETIILAPADSSELNTATVRVSLGFSQAEGASFVKAALQLLQESSLVEQRETGILLGTAFTTPVQNGETYTVRARVQDANGLWSAWEESTFDVVYLLPVEPVVEITYLKSTGYTQIGLSLPSPSAGESEAELVSIRRVLNGVEELLVEDYPAEASLTFLDTTPSIHGLNTYRITVTSALGAQRTVSHVLETEECRRAFLSKGPGYSIVISFGGNLSVTDALNVASTVFQAAGRVKPIGQYGVETSQVLKVSSTYFEGFGSTREEMEAFFKIPGKACFRDATGRRVFGVVKGSLDYSRKDRGTLKFTLTETD